MTLLSVLGPTISLTWFLMSVQKKVVSQTDGTGWE